jgi:hypothetical protein
MDRCADKNELAAAEPSVSIQVRPVNVVRAVTQTVTRVMINLRHAGAVERRQARDLTAEHFKVVIPGSEQPRQSCSAQPVVDSDMQSRPPGQAPAKAGVVSPQGERWGHPSSLPART